MRPTMAARNDLRRTPLDAITTASISQRRRRAFGAGSLLTGPPPDDPVTGRQARILPRPLLPVRTHGIDVYL